MNDENLYFSRHKPYFMDTIDELFIYTEEQKEVLLQDLEDDLEEELNEEIEEEND